MSVVVLIPLLGRPDQVEPLLASLKGSIADVDVQPYFLLSPNDQKVIDAVRRNRAPHSVVDWEPERGDYAKKMNLGAAHVLSGAFGDIDWLFLGARDLRFHVRWADEAVRVGEGIGKRVVGTNDLGNPMVVRGKHSTHPLVHVSYVKECGTIDEPGLLCHEGYWHNWVDNELVETAISRREWVFAPKSHVEHLHWVWKKSTMDEVYERGREHYKDDQRLFASRRRMWRRPIRGGRAR